MTEKEVKGKSVLRFLTFEEETGRCFTAITKQCKSDSERQWTLPSTRGRRNKWALRRGRARPLEATQLGSRPPLPSSCTPSSPHAQNKPDIWVCIPNPSNLKTKLHFQKNLVRAKLMRSAWLNPAPGQRALIVASIWHSKLRQEASVSEPRGVHVRSLSVNCFS